MTILTQGGPTGPTGGTGAQAEDHMTRDSASVCSSRAGSVTLSSRRPSSSLVTGDSARAGSVTLTRRELAGHTFDSEIKEESHVTGDKQSVCSSKPGSATRLGKPAPSEGRTSGTRTLSTDHDVRHLVENRRRSRGEYCARARWLWTLVKNINTYLNVPKYPERTGQTGSEHCLPLLCS